MDRPTPKRRRMNVACNYCRGRKTKCDGAQPSCNACRQAGVECITSHKSRPQLPVQRRETFTSSMDNRPSITPAAVQQNPDQGLLAQQNLDTPTETPNRFTPRPSRSPPASLYAATPTGILQPREAILATNAETITTDPQTQYAGRLPLMPRLGGSSSIQRSTAWLDLAFYRLGLPQDPSFSSFLLGTEDQDSQMSVVQLPSLEPPTLPPVLETQNFVKYFIDTFNEMLPILTNDEIDRVAATVQTASEDQGVLRFQPIHQLSTLYLVVLLGRMTGPSARSEWIISTYMNFCKMTVGTLQMSTSLSSVKAMFLYASALRIRNQIDASWHLICHAIAMAQSLGLHRNVRAAPPISRERMSTWWCLYSMEKMLSLELCQPSAIRDQDCDQLEPLPTTPVKPGKPPFFGLLVAVAKAISQVNEKSSRARTKEEASPDHRLEDAIKDKIFTSGELSVLLINLGRTFPDEMRPSGDILCSPSDFTKAQFLTALYNYTVMMSGRNSLLIDMKELHRAVEMYGADQPWKYNLQNGNQVCANAARSTIRLLADHGANHQPPLLLALSAPLLAAFVLAVYMIKYPSSKLIQSDFNLMRTAMDLAIAAYEKTKNDGRLREVLDILQERVTQHLDKAGSSPETIRTPSIAISAPTADMDATIAQEIPWSESFLVEFGWDWAELGDTLGIPFGYPFGEI